MHKVALAVAVLVCVVATATPAPKVRSLFVGTPTASGSLDAKTLEAVVRKSKTKLLACVTKQDGEFSTTVTFTVGTDGKITNAGATGGGSRVEACVAAAISKLKFAASTETTGVVFELTYTLVEPYDPNEPRQGILGSMGSGEDDNIYGGLIGNQVNEPAGGYGVGTIGTGRVGPIGHGSGTGSGYVAAHVSFLVSVGQPTVTGDLDKAIIRRYIKRNIQKLQYCYEKELLVTKTLQGTITAEFTITANGSVGTSTATGMKSKNVESCVASVIQNIEFPKPKGDSAVTVSYPLTFTPPPPPKKTK